MTSIQDIEKNLLEEFEFCQDWQEKYELIIELGMDLPPLDTRYKTEENRIIGCQSTVWLQADYDSESHKMVYQADSEAMIVKGLVSLLIELYSGQSPETILQSELSFFKTLGLEQHLSTTRSNGLAAMMGKMRQYAAQHIKPL